MKTTIHRRASLCLALGLLAGAALPSGAQSASPYPQKPIKLVVSSAAGGGADTVARLIALKLADAFKQPVVVENKPGASGTLAATTVLGAPADGYTLLFGITTMAQLPAVTQTPLPFNTERDFIPVSLVAKSRNVLFASKKTQAKTVPELIAALNAQTLSYGSWGNGSTGHFMGDLFARQTRTQPTHVPYKCA